MARTVLYQLAISHYNEKARWALDLKRVPHVRRTVLPGAHVAVALGLARTTTLPVLVIDGEATADSTAIIAELERRYPEPPLYPADAAERTRALAIEDEADETLGPAIRRLAHNQISRDRSVGPEILAGGPGLQAQLVRLNYLTVRPFVKLKYGVSDEASVQAEAEIRGWLDRVVRDTAETGYFVGDRFSVADLTVAALFGPLVRPPEFGPSRLPLPDSLRAKWDELGAHPGADWVRGIFARHRFAVPVGAPAAA